MKKRISALILCICFAAAASGCGNTEDTDNRERNVQEERTGAGEDSGTAADESTADTSELQEMPRRRPETFWWLISRGRTMPYWRMMWTQWRLPV